jgi:hypothetical protein
MGFSESFFKLQNNGGLRASRTILTDQRAGLGNVTQLIQPERKIRNDFSSGLVRPATLDA